MYTASLSFNIFCLISLDTMECSESIPHPFSEVSEQEIVDSVMKHLLKKSTVAHRNSQWLMTAHTRVAQCHVSQN